MEEKTRKMLESGMSMEDIMAKEIFDLETLPDDLKTVIKKSKLPADIQANIASNMVVYHERATKWKEQLDLIVITDESQKAEMKLAREVRLALRQVRIEADKKREELKADSLAYGRTVQTIYNAIASLIEPLETKAQGLEDYAKLKEEKRKADLLAARMTEISKFIHFINLNGLDLGAISNELYEDLKTKGKLAYEKDIEDRIEAQERKAEQDEADRKKAEADKILLAQQQAEIAKLKVENTVIKETMRDMVQESIERPGIDPKPFMVKVTHTLSTSPQPATVSFYTGEEKTNFIMLANELELIRYPAEDKHGIIAFTRNKIREEIKNLIHQSTL